MKTFSSDFNIAFDILDILENVDAATLKTYLSKYYLDFVLFGYDIQPILDILQLKENTTTHTSTSSTEKV